MTKISSMNQEGICRTTIHRNPHYGPEIIKVIEPNVLWCTEHSNMQNDMCRSTISRYPHSTLLADRK